MGAFVKSGKIIFRSDKRDEQIASVKDAVLEGEHNLQNILAAVTVAKIVGVRNSDIKKTLKSPLMLEGRQELVHTVRGVKYINDTTSTTPDAGIAALHRFGARKKIVLIAGGADKKLEYPEWARQLKTAFTGWRTYFLTNDFKMPKLMRLSPSKKTPLYNGALDCRLFEIAIVAGSNRKKII